MRDTLLEEFDSILKRQPSVGAADRESMISRLQDAFNDPSLVDAASVDPEHFQVDVEGTLGQLQRDGVLDRSDVEEARGVFAKSFEGLQNEAVQRALEFARISREQGEVAARAWLSTQSNQVPPVDNTVPHHVAAALKHR
ncbi:hypothetical protein [Luteimonas sp. gir]|uniref:hypothetical protein n=1 Tax=Luteimonas sp. gir TaxID=3127960 RepID=UPI003075B638